jgi:hypothetical protein
MTPLLVIAGCLAVAAVAIVLTVAEETWGERVIWTRTVGHVRVSISTAWPVVTIQREP